jgi:ubiquinone/menaquinone biosynthesis C-methylase UbiE/uncharacterized protein YbaR (Trm112 family)
VNSDLIDLLRCPHDGSFPLRLLSSGAAVDARKIDEGLLQCADCLREYPVALGIPSFLGGLQAMVSGQEAEIHSRNESFERVRHVPPHRKPAIDAFQAAMPDSPGFTLLDCGCGNGQVTAAWNKAGRVAALDFSPVGLINFLSPLDPPHFDLVHGDATSLPFRSCTFDVAMAAVLIHHLPTPQFREACVRELHRVLKPGGRVILSVYNWNETRRRAKEPQEGYFDQAVFYHRYTAGELRELLAGYFEVERIMGVYVNLPGTYRALRASRLNLIWDRLWRNTGVALRYSHLLVAVSRRGL